MVGMRHLRLALPDFHPTADNPAFTGRQHAADVIVTGVEEDDLQPSCFILCDHAPGAATSRWRLVMLDNQNLEGGDAAIDKVGQRRPGPPVDQADREVAKQVYDMRADALFQHPGQFRANTRQHGRRGEQAIDFGRASWMHDRSVWWRCRGPRLPESLLQNKRPGQNRGPGAKAGGLQRDQLPRWQQMRCFAARRAAYCRPPSACGRLTSQRATGGVRQGTV